MPSFADVYASVKLDLSREEENRLQRKVGSIDASKAGAKTGKTFGTGFSKAFIGLAGGLFAGIGLTKLFSGFIADAAEAAKISRITASAIKDTGGAAKITAQQVADLSQELSNKTAVDDELVQTGANLLLTFKNIRNEVGAGNDIFNQATAAALDLSAAGFGSVENSAVKLGKALNDPVAGITALNKVGITFSKTQKEQIKDFVEAGDILSAQKIILGEVASQMGTAAESAAGPLDRLRVVAGNLGEKVGEFLLPYLEDFSTWLIDKGIPKVEELIETFRDEWIPVIEDVVKWVKDHKDELLLLAQGIGAVIVAVKAWTAAQWLLNAALAANPIGALITLVGAAVAILIKVRQVTGSWGDAIRALHRFVSTVPILGPLMKVLGDIDKALASIGRKWASVKSGFETGIRGIPGIGSLFGTGGKGGAFSSALAGATGRVFPLPPGTYRWGRGAAAHGYDAQDLPVPTGTPVRAPVSGLARGIDLGNRSYGKYVQIASGQFGRVILAHLSRLFVGAGFVRAGQIIGLSGSTGNSTGPHLHVEPTRVLRFAAGGVINEMVLGIGASSGRGYILGERGPETVTPGVGGAAGGDTFIINSPMAEQIHALERMAQRRRMARLRVAT